MPMADVAGPKDPKKPWDLRPRGIADFKLAVIVASLAFMVFQFFFGGEGSDCSGPDTDSTIARCTRAFYTARRAYPNLFLSCQRRAFLYRSRGIAYGEKGFTGNAIADLDRAIRYNPNSALAYAARGAARERMADHEGARADFDAALRIDGKLVVALIDRGALSTADGDSESALADLNEALRLAPLSAAALTARGVAYQAKGEHDLAIADFEKAISFAPKQASAYRGRGVSYRAKGDSGHALADLEAAERLDPNGIATRGLFPASAVACASGPVLPAAEPSSSPASTSSSVVSPR